ncbi:MAG: TIGR04438 family Trp-rich protein [Proteobacteria bacterium]|nr:TIGR04438 family Trp-rich protein [Pseudomonadota bacterium]
MLFVIVGVLLVVLNLAGIGPVGNWTWTLGGDLWKFALPFLLAIVWWWWADTSGLNKRREMEKMEDRKRKRREDNLQALGLETRGRRKGREGGGR